MKNNLWFKRKTYGYGWTPTTWQGWAVIVVWLISFYLVITGINSELVKLVSILILTGILIFVSYKKGERPRWQWGEKEEADK
jgi:hypothetical protein